MTVAVIGGGITGLVAARRLALGGQHVELYEATDRFGGKILGAAFAGLPNVEAGPDAVLARVPWARELIGELGIDPAQVVSPATGRAFIAHRGGLHAIPDGLVLGVPAGLGGLARSNLLSVRGKLRAAADVVLPRRSVDHDSLGRTISQRFGAEVLDLLVDPLVGSINAGDSNRLSLTASTPQIAPTAARSRSLLLGLRKLPRPPASTDPVFITPRDGLGSLVAHLLAELERLGVGLHPNTPVESVSRDGRTYVLDVAGQSTRVDGLVLACPAFAAADLLRDIAPDSARGLASIVYAGVVMVTVHVDDRRVLDKLPAGSGILVPKPDQIHLTAASFATRKWEHWQPPGGGEILRLSLGRLGNEVALGFDDATCAEVALKELAMHTGIAGDPPVREVRVSRWPRAFPQYEPHHLQRVAAIEEAFAREVPGIVAGGAAYRGVGIPACIRQGGEAAEAMSAWLAEPSESSR